jgi:hypothetical protein
MIVVNHTKFYTIYDLWNKRNELGEVKKGIEDHEW